MWKIITICLVIIVAVYIPHDVDAKPFIFKVFSTNATTNAAFLNAQRQATNQFADLLSQKLNFWTSFLNGGATINKRIGLDFQLPAASGSASGSVSGSGSSSGSSSSSGSTSTTPVDSVYYTEDSDSNDISTSTSRTTTGSTATTESSYFTANVDQPEVTVRPNRPATTSIASSVEGEIDGGFSFQSLSPVGPASGSASVSASAPFASSTPAVQASASIQGLDPAPASAPAQAPVSPTNNSNNYSSGYNYPVSASVSSENTAENETGASIATNNLYLPAALRRI